MELGHSWIMKECTQWMKRPPGRSHFCSKNLYFSNWLLLLLLVSWAKPTLILLSWKFNFNSAKMCGRCFHYSFRERVDSEWLRAVRTRFDFRPGSGSGRFRTGRATFFSQKAAHHYYLWKYFPFIILGSSSDHRTSSMNMKTF